MGSVVTHDVSPYEIWAGNPAKFIRKRFSDEVVDEINCSQWWMYSDKELEEFAMYFNDPDEFLRRIKQ